MSHLSISNAAVRLDGQTLLGPIDLDLATPGITVVMGPNGAGKSLFLRLLHGLLPAHGGSVLWDGVEAAASRATRGFVFQRPPVLRRSVLANLAYPLQAKGLSRKVALAQASDHLPVARLAGRGEEPAATLSGGEMQRMALARALVTGPKVVLLDEPSASLDPASTAALEAMIKEVASKGVKVILSTHDVAQARRLAKDILFIAEGKVTQQSDRDAFFDGATHPAVRAYLEGRL